MSVPDVVWLHQPGDTWVGRGLEHNEHPELDADNWHAYIRRTDDDIAEARRLVEDWHEAQTDREEWDVANALAAFIEQRYLGGSDE